MWTQKAKYVVVFEKIANSTQASTGFQATDINQILIEQRCNNCQLHAACNTLHVHVYFI